MWRIFLLVFWASSAVAEDGDSSGGDSGITAAIVAAINAVKTYVVSIFESITKFVEYCGELVVAVFKAAWDFITDSFIWLLESVFKLAAEAIKGASDGLGIPALVGKISALWAAIPVEVTQVLAAIGISSALTIVVLGIVIRMTLQLIPFVRLGS